MFRKILVEATGVTEGLLDTRNRKGECAECGFPSEVYPMLRTVSFFGYKDNATDILFNLLYICQGCYDKKRGEG